MSPRRGDGRRRGRPKKLENGARVSTWLSAGELDEVIADARLARKSVSAFLRTIIQSRRRREYSS